MTDFLRDLADFLAAQPFPVTRVAEARSEEEIETLELRPDNACQNVYSVAKLFTATAVGLLRDKGLLDVDERVFDILQDELP